jgi:glycosyltransferase involved in cell wall biosynthesis
MTLGLPVVTTPQDGSERDLIDEGANGHLVADDDVDALLEGVRRVLEASDIEREAMGRRSAEIVEKTVNVDAMVDGFVAAFERATGNPLATDES